VHVDRRYDLPEWRRALASHGRMDAFGGSYPGVKFKALDQVLEPCRIATGQHGEAFQAEQCQHFVDSGVAGGDAARGIIVSLQYGEGCRRRSRSAPATWEGAARARRRDVGGASTRASVYHEQPVLWTTSRKTVSRLGPGWVLSRVPIQTRRWFAGWSRLMAGAWT
jgi:hypothetical protein